MLPAISTFGLIPIISMVTVIIIRHRSVHAPSFLKRGVAAATLALRREWGCKRQNKSLFDLFVLTRAGGGGALSHRSPACRPPWHVQSVGRSKRRRSTQESLVGSGPPPSIQTFASQGCMGKPERLRMTRGLLNDQQEDHMRLITRFELAKLSTPELHQQQTRTALPGAPRKIRPPMDAGAVSR